MAVGLAQVQQLSAASLYGALFETGFYFMYILTFPISLWLMLRNGGKQGSVNKVILAFTILVFVSTTTHWVLTVIRLQRAFIVNGTTALGPALYYANMSDPLELMKVSMYVMGGTIMDFMMIYRLHLVWGRSYLIAVIPTLATLTQLGGYCIQMSKYAKIKFIIGALHDKPVGAFIIMNYCCTISVTVFCTVMITYRIIRKNGLLKRAANYNSWNLLKPVLQIVIEGAMVYGFLALLVLCLYVLDHPWTFFVLDISPPIVATNHSAILIRVHTLRNGSSTNGPPSGGSSHKQTFSGERRMMKGPNGETTPIKIIRQVDFVDDLSSFPMQELHMRDLPSHRIQSPGRIPRPIQV